MFENGLSIRRRCGDCGTEGRTGKTKRWELLEGRDRMAMNGSRKAFCLFFEHAEKVLPAQAQKPINRPRVMIAPPRVQEQRPSQTPNDLASPEANFLR